MPPTLFLASATVALCAIVGIRRGGAHLSRILLLCGVGVFYLLMVQRLPEQSAALFLVVPGAAQLVWADRGRVAISGFFVAGLGLVLSTLSLAQMAPPGAVVALAIVAAGVLSVLTVHGPRALPASRSRHATGAMALSLAVSCGGGALAALGAWATPIGAAAAAFAIAGVVGLRTPPGHWGDRRMAVTFLVVTGLAVGALVLDGRPPAAAFTAAWVAVFTLGAAMILSPRLLRRPGRRSSSAPALVPNDAARLSDATLAHIVPLWADEDARAADVPLVMTRVSAHQVVQAAQVALRRQRRGEGARLTLDVDGAPSALDFDGDAQRVSEALAMILDAALERGQGMVTLSLRGDGRMVVFEIADTANVGEARSAIPERIRPFRDRGIAQNRRGAAYAQHIVEQHGGTLSTRFTAAGRIRQIELPRRRRETNAQSV